MHTERKCAEAEIERKSETDPGFAPHRRIAANAGFRAVAVDAGVQPERRAARDALDALPHEVSQPIAASVANGQACLEWLDREVPDLPEARTAVARIIRDGNRARELIHRIARLRSRGDVSVHPARD